MATLDQSWTRTSDLPPAPFPSKIVLLKGWSWELKGAFLLQLQAFLYFFFFLILTRLLVRIKGTNVPFHSLPKPCLSTQLEPSKMPDQIIPWEKYYDDSQKGKNTF